MAGVLIASGMHPRAVWDLSWNEIALYAECVMLDRQSMLTALLGPVAGAMGGEYAPGRVAPRESSKPKTPAQRDAAFLGQVAVLGLPMKTVKATPGA